MPKRNQTKRSAADIERAVKRHLEHGEDARTLAKEFGVSRAGFYLWVAKYKDRVMRESRRAGMTPRDVDRSERADLVAEVQALKHENRTLRDRLVSMLIKHGEL